MSHRVVDVLEAVKIEKEYSELAATALGHAQREIHALAQQQPVRQPGEDIAVGQRLDALLGCVLFAQVLEKTDAVGRVAEFVAQQDPGYLYRMRLPDRMAVPHLTLPISVRLQMLADPREKSLVMGVIEKILRRSAHQSRLNQSGQTFASRIHGQQQIVRTGDEDRVQTGIEHLRGQAQLGLRIDPLRDVAKREHPATGLATAILRQ